MYSETQSGIVDEAGDAGQDDAASFLDGSAEGEAPLAEGAAQPIPRPTPVSSLLAEIARAMQVAAEQERQRIDVGVGEDETAQIEKIHGRATAESDELKKQADSDVTLVNAWCKDQIQRIRADADHQIEERRARLEQSLTQHGSLIETEIVSVQHAVTVYRSSLGAFFGRLTQEPDPSEIARLAGTLPDPPDLQEVRAEARSRAMRELEDGPPAETQPVGVMDPGVQDAEAFRRTPLIMETSVENGNEPAPGEPASQSNIAVRVIRSLGSRSSPNGGAADHT